MADIGNTAVIHRIRLGVQADDPADLPASGYVFIYQKSTGFFSKDSVGNIAEIGADADMVDGEHANAFADASHTHGGGDITTAVANATDADTVDGSHAAAFAVSGHNHAGTYLANSAREFVFIAEFAGAVLQADGGSNTGTLTAAHDSTNRRNYYNWTTTSGTTQDYDLVLQFRLPPEFSAWKVSDVNVYMTSQVTATPGATGVRLVELLDASGTNRITAATKQNTSWTEDAYAITAGTWAAGDLVTIRIQFLADNAKNAMLHMLRIPWTAA